MRNFLNKYGYCYVAINRWSDVMATRSALTVRAYNPNAHITIFTDQRVKGKAFDNTIAITSQDPNETLKKFPQYPDQGILAKARHIPKAPYEYCVFSDNDIRYYGDISDVFELMERGNFDFCATLDDGDVSLKTFYSDVPYPMLKFHLGILAYHNNEKMQRVFSLQREYIIEEGEKGICGGGIDEVSFARAVFFSPDVRWCILPKSYCLRFVFPYIVRDTVRALHGRSETYDELIEAVNKDFGDVRMGFEGEILALYKPEIGFIRLEEKDGQ